MLGVERVVAGVLLLVGSTVALGRLWNTWQEREGAVGWRARTVARAAPAAMLVAGAAGQLGIFMAASRLTGAADERVRNSLIGFVIAVVVAVVAYAVIGWREHRRPVPAPYGPEPAVARAAAASSPPPMPEGWVPPTPQVAALLAARDAGDDEAVCAALAMEPLFARMRNVDVDRHLAHAGTLPGRVGRNVATGFELPLGTEGCVPTPAPDESVFSADVAWCAGADVSLLVIDEGHPHETRIDASAVRAWAAAHPEATGQRTAYRVHAISPVGTDHGLLHGLACAAHNAVMSGSPWNWFGPRGRGRLELRRDLRVSWGFESSRDWQQMLDALAEPYPSGPDLVFHLRRQLGEGAFVPAATVTDVVEDEVNVERNGRAVTDEVLAELRRVEAYERYLREQGVLAEWEQVHTLLAWDIGRGAMLARWGLDADFCDESTARWQLERFSRLARRYFDSWPEFGASLVLGRLLWSHERYDEYGDTMRMDAESSIRPFTVLMSEPTSPWRTVPFLPPAPAATAPPDEARTDAG